MVQIWNHTRIETSKQFTTGLLYYSLTILTIGIRSNMTK